jgi:pimeloyl-ACP methyl ester carboxylesterase
MATEAPPDGRPGLHVEEHPPRDGGSGPVVAVVHGSMDRCRTFLRLATRLPEYTVVLYDRRGYQRSREVAPPARGVGDHADDLVRVLHGRPSIVLGHSYGGDVALAAAERSDAVRAVVVYEPPLAWLDWWQMMGAHPNRPPLGEGEPGDAAESFLRRMVGDRFVDRLAPSARAELRADGQALVTELTALRSEPPPFDPARVTVPVVVARGSEPASRHRQGADWLVAELPDAVLRVVEGAGHGAHLSHPAALADLVREADRLASARPSLLAPEP